MHTKLKPTHYRPLCGGHWRAACGESLQARFGGGPTEKARATGTSPAAYPTLKASGGPRGPSLSQCAANGYANSTKAYRTTNGHPTCCLWKHLRTGSGSPLVCLLGAP
jgi:hypothetical protein